MDRRGFQLVMASVFLAALVGCGGSSVTPVPLADYDDESLDALCVLWTSCGYFPSEQVCKEDYGSFTDQWTFEIQQAVADGSVIYDGEAARRCLDLYPSFDCDPSTSAARMPIDVCRDVFTGTVADGSNCVLYAQCISGVCAGSDLPMCTIGACASRGDPAPLGASCGTNQPCVFDAYCNAGTCADLKARGSSCTDDRECDFGSVCGGNPSTCVTTPQLGDTCVGDAECPVSGLTCDSVSNICRSYLFEGDTCDPNNDRCFVLHATCDVNTLTCTRYPIIGQTCDFWCRGDASCDFVGTSSTCLAPQSDGSACDFDFDCTGYCSPDNLCISTATCLP